jgi:hypothetical protein
MIKFVNQVPSVYTSASRDFQYLSWLIDIVLNSVKHNVDDIYNLPNNKADPKLTELLAMTLGFKVKRNYDQNQLSALVVALPRILKYKGTKTAIDMAGNALIAASGAAGSFQSTITGIGELEVTFPVNLVDISLFTDLLDYILPAGMTCHIVRQNQEIGNYTTELDYEDRLYADCIVDLNWNDQTQRAEGLSANLFDIDALADQGLVLTNFRADARGNTDSDLFNIGLLDNNVIPTFNKVAPLRVNGTEIIEPPEVAAIAIIDEPTTAENTVDTADIIKEN